MKNIRLIIDFASPSAIKLFMRQMRLHGIIASNAAVYKADALDFSDGLKRVPGTKNTDWLVIKKDGDRPDERKYTVKEVKEVHL